MKLIDILGRKIGNMLKVKLINLKLTIRWKLSETETCIMVSVF